MLLNAIFASLRPTEQIYVWRREPHKRLLLDNPGEVYEFGQKNQTSDVYFGVAPRIRGEFDTVSRLTTVWADVDFKDFGGSTERAAKAVGRFPVLPSFVVRSGRGWHIYWLLASDVNPKIGQEIMRGIMHIIGSCPVHDPTHVLRIPGSYHCKDPDNRLKVFQEEEHQDYVYDAEDLRRLCRLGAETLDAIPTQVRKGLRSERDWRVIRELVALNVSDRTIYQIAAQRPIGERWRENDFRLLRQDLSKARSHYAVVEERFIEALDAWYYVTAKGKSQVSTFVFEPQRLIHSIDARTEDVFLGRMRSTGRIWEDVFLPRNAFSSAQSFLRQLPLMHWQWFANDYTTKQLLVFLMKQLHDAGMPEAFGTRVVGRHDNFWVTKEETLGPDRSYSPDEAPYTFISLNTSHRDAKDVIPNLAYPECSNEDYRELVQEISRLLPRINEVDVSTPTIGWIFAAPLKPLLNVVGVRFPHLNIYGTMGSGKTASLVDVYLPLLGVKNPTTQTSETTKFVLRLLLSSSNAVPIVFGEFREAHTGPLRNDFLSLLRMAYDTGMDSRGRADLTTETYILSAPVIVDGEDAFADPALRQRSITVNLHPETIAEGSPSNIAFKKLTSLPLRNFARRYIQRTLRETPSSVEERYNRLLKLTYENFPDPLPDRVRNGLGVVYLGIELFNEHVTAWGGRAISMEKSSFKEPMDNVLMRLKTGVSRALVDDFVEDVIVYISNDANLRITFINFYDSSTNILWIHLNSAIHWWTRSRRFEGKTVLDNLALRAQLMERCNPTTGYAIPETPINTSRGIIPCFGIKISNCQNIGLSVPDRLSTKILAMRGNLITVKEKYG